MNNIGDNLKALRILLVEDNAMNQMVATHMLEKRGHAVTVASNGREGVEIFTRSGMAPYDIILMDIQMPEMDGLEATAAIRELQRRGAPRTPIVAMTAHAMKGDRERCLAAGMDGYISKPVRSQDLLQTIGEVLAQYRSDAAAEPLAAAEPVALFDPARLMERLPTAESIQPLIHIFQDQYPRQIADLRAAVEHRDSKTLAVTAHTLRGSLLVFSAGPAAAAAQTLEMTGRDGDLAGAAAALATLEAEIGALSAALDAFAASLTRLPER